MSAAARLAYLLALAASFGAPGCRGEDVVLGSDALPAHADGGATSVAFSLRVVNEAPDLPLATGRVVVVWTNAEDPGVPVVVAYDAPFDPAAAVHVVGAGAISPPPSSVLRCDGPCASASTRWRIATGYVLVVHDSDGDGHATAAEIPRFAEAIGVGNLLLVHSDRDIDPAVTPPLDAPFPDEVRAGIEPRAVAPQPAGDDRFPAATTATFDLAVCPPAASGCVPRAPRLH